MYAGWVQCRACSGAPFDTLIARHAVTSIQYKHSRSLTNMRSCRLRPRVCGYARGTLPLAARIFCSTQVGVAGRRSSVAMLARLPDSQH